MVNNMAFNLIPCHNGSTLFWTEEISVSVSVKTDTKQRKSNAYKRLNYENELNRRATI